MTIIHAHMFSSLLNIHSCDCPTELLLLSDNSSLNLCHSYLDLEQRLSVVELLLIVCKKQRVLTTINHCCTPNYLTLLLDLLVLLFCFFKQMNYNVLQCLFLFAYKQCGHLWSSSLLLFYWPRTMVVCFKC